MNNFLNQLRVPSRFEQADNAFWQNPYIAKQLLKAHLNSDNEGASRSFSFIDKSIDFIQQIAPQKSYQKVLDLGCGPGLYCERLAKKNYTVTGIDFSENSIRYAQEQAKKLNFDIDYRYENYMELNDSNNYDLALLIYCDYGALAPVDRSKLLFNIWNSLKNGGQLLLDVFSQNKFDQFKEEQYWSLNENGGFWSKDSYVAIGRNLKYPDRVTLEQTTVVTKDKMETYNIWHQYFTKELLIKEVTAVGFTVKEIYDDVSGQTGNGGSETIALLLEK
ncbi:class I SAM-dependent methyltransferase [Cytobacillus sp. Sa5YUA1]|uniref:Class I SAM-dependent methyltransferase n=1 Tax=Cytobacillus stercorigallinarum TaxID=2762240 RepID=A0ABR8QRY0_9BACI|nr:class I SAM-dependent methyltransferase [Cytobacillus stercorigallinarum]MBD7938285.1 class I SAM-dependent methyltransferase [Cytobacillus stercorigallinarum]